MADSPATPDGLTDEQLVNSIVGMTKAGADAHKTRVAKSYDPAYETYRAKPSKAPRLPGWRSQVRVPYAQQNIDTAMVNIVAGVPRCVVQPLHPKDVVAAKVMQAAMDFYVQADHLVEKQPLVAQQGLVMGATVAKNTWGYDEATVTRRVWIPDANGELHQTVNRQEHTVILDRPCFEPWSVYDCYWDPNGRDVDTCKYVVLDSWLGKDDLEKRRFNPETGRGWRNIDQLYETAAKKRSDSYQDQLLGQLNRHKGQFKVSEVWTDDAVFTIGNDHVLLEAKANPYWHGKKPIVIAQTRPDLFELQGIPEVDLLRDIQDALHTLQNMTIDSVHLSVMRGVTYREGSVVDPNTLVIRPQFKWGVQDHDDVRPFEIPPVNSDVFQERERLQSDMQTVTGITQYLSGTDSAGVDQNTATAVTAFQTAGGALMRFKANLIHFKIFQRTFEQWGSNIQQFQTRDMALEISGDDGVPSWAEVAPHHFAGEFHFKLSGSEENLSRQNSPTRRRCWPRRPRRCRRRSRAPRRSLARSRCSS